VEPYRKSLVEDLYLESVEVDPMDSCDKKVTFEPFVGVAPRRYSDFFDISSMKRKNKDGSVKQWRPAGAVPRLPEYMPTALTRLTAEQEETRVFVGQLRKEGLSRAEKEN
jgi:cytidine deaminase